MSAKNPRSIREQQKKKRKKCQVTFVYVLARFVLSVDNLSNSIRNVIGNKTGFLKPKLFVRARKSGESET